MRYSGGVEKNWTDDFYKTVVKKSKSFDIADKQFIQLF